MSNYFIMTLLQKLVKFMMIWNGWILVPPIMIPTNMWIEAQFFQTCNSVVCFIFCLLVQSNTVKQKYLLNEEQPLQLWTMGGAHKKLFVIDWFCFHCEIHYCIVQQYVTPKKASSSDWNRWQRKNILKSLKTRLTTMVPLTMMLLTMMPSTMATLTTATLKTAPLTTVPPLTA